MLADVPQRTKEEICGYLVFQSSMVGLLTRIGVQGTKPKTCFKPIWNVAFGRYPGTVHEVPYSTTAICPMPLYTAIIQEIHVLGSKDWVRCTGADAGYVQPCVLRRRMI